VRIFFFFCCDVLNPGSLGPHVRPIEGHAHEDAKVVKPLGRDVDHAILGDVVGQVAACHALGQPDHDGAKVHGHDLDAVAAELREVPVLVPAKG